MSVKYDEIVHAYMYYETIEALIQSNFNFQNILKNLINYILKTKPAVIYIF